MLPMVYIIYDNLWPHEKPFLPPVPGQVQLGPTALRPRGGWGSNSQTPSTTFSNSH